VGTFRTIAYRGQLWIGSAYFTRYGMTAGQCRRWMCLDHGLQVLEIEDRAGRIARYVRLTDVEAGLDAPLGKKTPEPIRLTHAALYGEERTRA